MPALLRLVGTAIARYFDPGADDLLDTIVDGTPTPVTVEVYPVAPAAQITGQALAINGTPRTFTSVAGQNPSRLQFHLGGDPGENVGAVNTVAITVTDDAAGATQFVLRYFRKRADAASPVAATTTTTTRTQGKSPLPTTVTTRTPRKPPTTTAAPRKAAVPG
jgi:hypothetical protein